MSNINLQIRVPEETVAQIQRLAPRSKSSFVRKAIEEKIDRETCKRLEAKWVQALKKHPEQTRDDKAWLKAEEWGPM